eukprot:COSAG04_NODE_3688_length_2605_cov_3.627694_3_plen_206_part_00
MLELRPVGLACAKHADESIIEQVNNRRTDAFPALSAAASAAVEVHPPRGLNPRGQRLHRRHACRKPSDRFQLRKSSVQISGLHLHTSSVSGWAGDGPVSFDPTRSCGAHRTCSIPATPRPTPRQRLFSFPRYFSLSQEGWESLPECRSARSEWSESVPSRPCAAERYLHAMPSMNRRSRRRSWRAGRGGRGRWGSQGQQIAAGRL